MIKKEYMKPEMEVVKIQQQCQILAGSNEGLNDNLQPDEVPDGWAPGMFEGDAWDILLGK
jgi:hypothetical protein